MLGTQLNELIHSNELQTNSLIQIKDYMMNKVKQRTVLIVLALNVVNRDPGHRIGQPVDIEKANIKTSATPSAQPMYNRTNQPPSQAAGKPKQEANPYGGGSAAQPPSRYGRPYTAPIVRTNTSSVHYTMIAQLNMYQNRWTLRARVTSKSDIRTWSNAKGEGSLFSIELLDSSGVDIKATFFKEAVEKFYPLIEANRVYTFSGGRVKVANVQWNTCKSSFEITFDQNSEIHLADDTGDIEEQIFEFVKIADLENTEAGKTVDIIGVVKAVGEPTTLISKKSGQELTKCDLTVGDDSGADINVTVWGDKANKAPTTFAQQPVVAFRRVRVSDYGGKSLSTTNSGGTMIDPKAPETAVVKSWWKSSNGQPTSRSLSSAGGGGGRMEALADRKNISKIKSENLGTNGDKADYLSFKGTLLFLKKDKEGGAWYPACPNANEPCKNRFKVTQTPDQNWFCDKCQGTYPNCVRRWIFSGTVADETSTTWVSFFNEQAETLLDAVADDVYRETMGENHDQDKYDSYFGRALYTDWVFRCKVKQELVGEETRSKTSVYTMHPVDYAKESRDLLDAIAKF